MNTNPRVYYTPCLPTLAEHTMRSCKYKSYKDLLDLIPTLAFLRVICSAKVGIKSSRSLLGFVFAAPHCMFSQSR